MTPEFLTRDDVLAIHERELARFGGLSGVRDEGLLESALAQPEAGFGGEYLHEDVFMKAAAYLFHVVKNHPFLDGNKRTGLIVALTFLRLNGVTVRPGDPSLYDATIAVAEGRLDKEGVAALFRELAGAAG